MAFSVCHGKPIESGNKGEVHSCDRIPIACAGFPISRKAVCRGRSRARTCRWAMMMSCLGGDANEGFT